MNASKFFSFAVVVCALFTSIYGPFANALGATAEVSVVNDDFVPGNVTIDVGDQVTWTWAASTGGIPHNTRSDSGLWDSGIHTQPFSFTHQFTSEGTFPYHCDVHPGMDGTVIVQGAPQPQAPTITTQPQSRTVQGGDSVMFTVQATGTPPLSYQWRFNGAAITGETSGSLTLNNVSEANAGAYSVMVSNAGGSVTSSDAILTMTPGGGGGGAPKITTQPQSRTVEVGDDVTLTVQGSGDGPLSYQWLFNGAEIPGGTGSSLTLEDITEADAGTYSVVVSNASGSTTSAGAVLTVTPEGSDGEEFVRGTYTGLFFVPGAITHEASGLVSIKVTPRGKLSGKLQSGRGRHSMSGLFDSNRSATITVIRPGEPDLTVALQMDQDRLLGTVSDGTATADLIANRDVFGRTQAAPQAGQYTLVIPGADDSAIAPGGNSIGTVRVDARGKIKLAGSLADGTKITQKSAVSGDGDWPLYVPLYGGQGSLVGWISFGAGPGEGFSGNVVWTKPNVASAQLYPGGFVLDTTVAGFRYIRPSSGNNVLTFTDGALTLSGGDLNQDLINEITIDPKNKVQNLGENQLKLKLKPQTGMFNGRIEDPNSGTRIPFTGVVRQDLDLGTGYFIGSTESGLLSLESP